MSVHHCRESRGTRQASPSRQAKVSQMSCITVELDSWRQACRASLTEVVDVGNAVLPARTAQTRRRRALVEDVHTPMTASRAS